MPNTTFLDSQLNKAAWGATSYTPAATVWYALSSTTPTQAGANFTEPSGNGYGRVSTTNNTTNFVATTSQPGTGQSQSNGVAITFPAATGAAASWGTVTYLGIYDASSAGNLLWYGALTVPQTIGGGDTFSVAIQGLTVTLN